MTVGDLRRFITGSPDSRTVDVVVLGAGVQNQVSFCGQGPTARCSQGRSAFCLSRIAGLKDRAAYWVSSISTLFPTKGVGSPIPIAGPKSLCLVHWVSLQAHQVSAERVRVIFSAGPSLCSRAFAARWRGTNVSRASFSAVSKSASFSSGPIMK
jgi:hypothetical protein